jgi:hypothetical protein
VPEAHLQHTGAGSLKTLFEQMRVGIHQLSEEECLETALAIRSTVNYVFKNLVEAVSERNPRATWRANGSGYSSALR